MPLAAVSEELFLITYQRNGLLQRDNWFEQREQAQNHYHYLQQLFPDSQVQLHVIPYSQPEPASSRHYLEL